MNHKNNAVFTEATVEIIHFEEEDILTSSSDDDIELPFDPFSLRRPSLDFLGALENAENE
jgi:hypothetical protein